MHPDDPSQRHELGAGEAILYTYGPDADAVFEVIEESLQDFPVGAGSYAMKRYDAGPEAREERVPLG